MINSFIIQFSELILLATQTKLSPNNNNPSDRFLSSSNYQIKIPETVPVIEAVSETPSSYRKSDKLIVSDGRNLVFTAPNEQHYFVEFSNRTLNSAEIEDKKIIRRQTSRLENRLAKECYKESIC